VSEYESGGGILVVWTVRAGVHAGLDSRKDASGAEVGGVGGGWSELEVRSQSQIIFLLPSYELGGERHDTQTADPSLAALTRDDKQKINPHPAEQHTQPLGVANY